METKFNYENYLIGVNDSMELESGWSVASLEWEWISVDLRVCGDVRVVFDGTAYRSSSQFPDELLKMFHDGTAYNDERVYIDMNNWFEVFVYEKTSEGWDWADWSEVVDGGWKSAGDIYDTLMSYLEDYVGEYWLDHAHAVLDASFPYVDEETKDSFICEHWQNMASDEYNYEQFKWYLINETDKEN